MQAEYYAFSGPTVSVASRVYQLPADMVGRLFYAMLVQNDEMADIHLFTRVEPGDREGRVAVWHGQHLDTLPERVLAALLSGLTDEVLRDKVVDVLRSHGEFTDLGVVPCPPTPRGAFGHPLRPYADAATVRTVLVGI